MDDQAALSSDGKTLAFVSTRGKELWFYSARTGFKDEASLYDNSPQPYAQIFRMNRDGSNVRQITDSRWEDSMALIVPERK